MRTNITARPRRRTKSTWKKTLDKITTGGKVATTVTAIFSSKATVIDAHMAKIKTVIHDYDAFGDSRTFNCLLIYLPQMLLIILATLQSATPLKTVQYVYPDVPWLSLRTNFLHHFQ